MTIVDVEFSKNQMLLVEVTQMYRNLLL